MNRSPSGRPKSVEICVSNVSKNPGERRKPKQKLRLVQRRDMTLQKKGQKRIYLMSGVGVAKSLFHSG